MLFKQKTTVIIFLLSSISMLGKSKAPETKNNKQYIAHLYAQVTGFGIPSDEVLYITRKGGAPTYGEITYEAAQELLEDLKLASYDIFYDLGSGIGKLAVQVALTTPAKKIVGVELSTTRHNTARKIAKQIKKDHKLSKYKKIAFENKNITEVSLKDATVIFMCSTCFSQELMQKIMRVLAHHKKGLRVVTLQKLPKNDLFILVKEYRLPMTWSPNSPVYLYCKK
ncbi:MAG: hypothetical protein WC707_04440 [Candidatus Babeliaceae bacterium]|jgi:precorrin-6B methylase 2